MDKIQNSLMDITLKLEARFNNRSPCHHLVLSTVLVLQCLMFIFCFLTEKSIRFTFETD